MVSRRLWFPVLTFLFFLSYASGKTAETVTAAVEDCQPTEKDDCTYPSVEDFPDCQAGRFWSSESVPGSHILCLRVDGSTKDTKQPSNHHRNTDNDDNDDVDDDWNWEDGKDIHVRMFVNGLKDKALDFKLSGMKDGTPRRPRHLMLDFKEEVESYFPHHPEVFYDNPKRQPWRVFDPQGRVLETFTEAMRAKTVFVMEGGQWIWPGVREGFRQRVHDVDDLEEVWLETMSLSPLVFRVLGFLKDKEIERILDHSKPFMAASGVALMDKDKGKPATEWRTSTTYWLRSREQPWIRGIDRRVSDITRVPISHQEDVQVLRYEPTQKYDAHHDFFNPKFHAQDTATLKMVEDGVKNRMSTVFWYMSDVEEGGTTWFPRAFGTPQPKSMKSCEGGLHVPPVKGSVIIFYNMLPSGALDELSLHGGCPVIKGEKWSANKWVWNKPR